MEILQDQGKSEKTWLPSPCSTDIEAAVKPVYHMTVHE